MDFIEILKSKKIYPGYPPHDERTEMGAISYAHWIANERYENVATPLHRHPKYLKGLEYGTAFDDNFGEANIMDVNFAPSFTGEYARDLMGKPIHPYAEQLFAAGFAIEGPGAYWTYGPNLCADPIVLGLSSDGRLKTVVITRGDTGVLAFPGGHCDFGENPMITAAREFHEETGIEILVDDLFLVECVYEGVVADPRTTLNSWPETSAFAIIIKPGVIDNYSPIGQDDAANAFVAPVDTALYKTISNMHIEYLRLAVSKFEEVANCQVQDNGVIAIQVFRR